MNFRTGVMETGTERGWSTTEFIAGTGKMKGDKKRKDRGYMWSKKGLLCSLFVMRKAACNQYGETSYVVSKNEWERTNLVYHHGKASSTFSEENVKFL
jgi:hypothetical protein